MGWFLAGGFALGLGLAGYMRCLCQRQIKADNKFLEDGIATMEGEGGITLG